MRLILLLISLFGIFYCQAQSCCLQSRAVVKTSFGEVEVYKAMNSARKISAYYYLPQQWRISQDERGNSQLSLLLTRDDEEQVTGGILHLLLQWGLLPHEKRELTDSLIQRDSSAVLAGSLWLESGSPSFEIGPAEDAIAIALNKSISSRSSIPVAENNKMAISFRLDSSSANLLEAVFMHHKNTEAYLLTRYRYRLLHCRGYHKSTQNFQLELVSRIDTWPAQLH